eukprot:TRINITY_DN10446_c0_g1_i1.p1 TRINITY_DN10446_c0_g1~~TRINITY_DN10446_c0_g1_i1.p1  ORF type:complete len:1439 (+),score=295.42 TRINITY_DN10446_c0_g1_i1:195-4319(+)
MPDSHTEREADIHCGDRIIAVDDQPVAERASLEEVLKLLDAHETSCRLTLYYDHEGLMRMQDAMKAQAPAVSRHTTAHGISVHPAAYRTRSLSMSRESLSSLSTTQADAVALARNDAVAASRNGKSLHKQPALSADKPHVVRLQRESPMQDLGITLKEHSGSSGSIMIDSLVEGSIAHSNGSLHAGDELLKVNGRPVQHVNCHRAYELLAKAGSEIELVVVSRSSSVPLQFEDRQDEEEDPFGSERPASSGRASFNIGSRVVDLASAGLMLEAKPSTSKGPAQTVIKSIDQELAASSGLAVGTGICKVNGQDVSTWSPQKVENLMLKHGGHVALSVSPPSDDERGRASPLRLSQCSRSSDEEMVTRPDSRSQPRNSLPMIRLMSSGGQLTLFADEPGSNLNSSQQLQATDAPPVADAIDVDTATIEPLRHEMDSRQYPGADDLERCELLTSRWDVPWPGYNPPEHTDPSVFANHRADAAQTPEQLSMVKFNQHDGRVDRRSHVGDYTLSQDGRPQCPLGRQGISGRGLFCHWGPNHAVHDMISRWSRQPDGRVMLEQNRPLLEVLALRHPSGQLHLPGVFIRPGENVYEADTRALQLAAQGVPGAVAGINPEDNTPSTVHIGSNIARAEAHGITLTPIREVVDSEGDATQSSQSELSPYQQAASQLLDCLQTMDVVTMEIFRGALDDPRNTDNAWLETIAFNHHDETGILRDIDFTDDGSPLQWLTVSDQCALCPEQLQLAEQLASAHQAYFAPRRSRRKSGQTICTVVLNKTSNKPFGFTIGTHGQGHHKVDAISADGLAANRLLIGDEILEINHISVVGWAHSDVTTKITSNANLELKIKRSPLERQSTNASENSPTNTPRYGTRLNSKSRPLSMSCRAFPHSCVLHRDWYDQTFGFNIRISDEGQVEVCKVTPGTPAEGNLQVGDMITSINNTSVLALARSSIGELCQGQLTLRVDVLRLSTPPGSSNNLAQFDHHRVQSVGRLDALDGGVIVAKLHRDPYSGGFGFGCGTTQDGQHYVTTVDDNVTEHQLLPGDRIVRIAGEEGDSLTDDRLHELAEESEELHLVVVRRHDHVDVFNMDFVARDFNVGSPAGRDLMAKEGSPTSTSGKVFLETGDSDGASSVGLIPLQRTASGKVLPDDVYIRLERSHGKLGLELQEIPSLSSGVRVLIGTIQPDASYEGDLKEGQQILKLRRHTADESEEWHDVSNDSKDAVLGMLRALGQSIDMMVSGLVYAANGGTSIRRRSHHHTSMRLDHGLPDANARPRGRLGRLVDRVHLGHRSHSNSPSAELSPDASTQGPSRRRKGKQQGHKHKHSGLFHMRKRHHSSTSNDVLDSQPTIPKSHSDHGLAKSERQQQTQERLRRSSSFTEI